jgi:DNA-binding FadR family transcriptional regulator
VAAVQSQPPRPEGKVLGLGRRRRLERSVKLPERIAASIVADIVSEGLQPGDRLPVEAVMRERLEVGRASLREALRILEVHGVISLRAGPGGGPVVTAVDPRDVARTFSLYLNIVGAKMYELADARLVLEPIVARMAAQNRDPKALERLRAAMDYEDSVSRDHERYIEAANNFHFTLTTMTGNKVIDLLATSLKELYTSRIVSSGVASRTTEPGIRNEHREIGEAVIAGDADRAEELMRTHMTVYVDQRARRDASRVADEVVAWG